MPSDIAVGFVLYNPGESAIQRINMLALAGYCVYVFDNSVLFSANRAALAPKEVRYAAAGHNLGLGVGLSQVCATAYGDGWKRLLFFDQDTRFNLTTLTHVERAAKDFDGAGIYDDYAIFTFSGGLPLSERVLDVDLAISSGSLFNLDHLLSIGWHNSSYFVDCVDYEICLRLRERGLKIGLVAGVPGFDHASEQDDKTVSVFGYLFKGRRYAQRRVCDALSAYCKLIFRCLRRGRFRDFLVIGRSMFIYLAGQILATIFIRSR